MNSNTKFLKIRERIEVVVRIAETIDFTKLEFENDPSITLTDNLHCHEIGSVLNAKPDERSGLITKLVNKESVRNWINTLDSRLIKTQQIASQVKLNSLIGGRI